MIVLGSFPSFLNNQPTRSLKLGIFRRRTFCWPFLSLGKNYTLHSTTLEDSSAWEAMDSWLGFATVGCLENVPNTCSPNCWWHGDLQCYNMNNHVKQIPKLCILLNYTWLVYLVHSGLQLPFWSSPWIPALPGTSKPSPSPPRASPLQQLGNCWEPSSVASDLKRTPQDLGVFVSFFLEGEDKGVRITPPVVKPVISHL